MSGARLLICVGLIALAAGPAGAAKAPVTHHAAAKRVAGDTSAVLVHVGDRVITRASVQARLDEIPESVRAQYSSPEGRQQLLERITEEQVWLVAATRAGVGDRAQVKQQLEQQRRDLLIRTYLGEVMAANPAPTDSEAKGYYDQHLNDYRMPATVTVRHIQLKTEAEARRVLGLARAKRADFAALVKQFTVDSLTRATGGLLGTVTNDGTFGPLGPQPALADSAFALPDSSVGGPFKTSRGWHVIRVEGHKAESYRSFDQVRPLIMRQLSGQRSQEFYRGLLDKTRKDLKVTSDSTAIRDFVSAKKSPRDLFKEAQEAGPTAERIRLYEDLLRQYPDADVAPQAQFMIGFINSEELKNYTEAEQAFRTLLARYPKSELAASAQWMIEHMRSEEAPPMLQMDADGVHGAASADTTRASGVRASGKGTTKQP